VLADGESRSEDRAMRPGLKQSQGECYVASKRVESGRKHCAERRGETRLMTIRGFCQRSEPRARIPEMSYIQRELPKTWPPWGSQKGEN